MKKMMGDERPQAVPSKSGGLGYLPNKNKHTPKPAAAPVSSSTQKVYPSTQMRAIVQMEQSLTEAQGAIEICSTTEGIGGTNDVKLQGHKRKLDDKIEKGDTVVQLLAPNVRIDDEGASEDLSVRGGNILQRARKMRDDLTFLSELTNSLHCTDPAALEHAPAFLHRAFTDAKTAGLSVPASCLGTIVERNAFGLLRERSADAAVSAANPDVDMTYGICILKDFPDLLSQTQENIIADIISESLAVLEKDPDQQAKDQQLYNRMHTIAKDADLKTCVLSIQKLLQHLTVPLAELDAAVKYFNTPGSPVPEKIARDMLAGSGRALLVQAKQTFLQRGIDAGSSPPWFLFLF